MIKEYEKLLSYIEGYIDAMPTESSDDIGYHLNEITKKISEFREKINNINMINHICKLTERIPIFVEGLQKEFDKLNKNATG